MAITFYNKVVNNVGTSDTLLISSGASTVTVMGLSLTNTSNNTVQVSVKLTDATPTTGYYLSNAILGPNASIRVVNGGERLVLGNNNSLYASSNIDSSVDCIVSYAQQT